LPLDGDEDRAVEWLVVPREARWRSPGSEAKVSTWHYALWVTPDDRAGPPLRALIETFAGRYGGPAFPPHITLSSQLSDLGLARRLAHECRLEIQEHRLARTTSVFEGLGGFVDQPFRALFLHPARLHWLLLAEARARRGSGSTVLEYLPHLSLFYGRLTSRQRRAAALAVDAERPLVFRPAAVEIWSVAAELDQVPLWNCVEAIPLWP
jgi:hypothetical protein